MKIIGIIPPSDYVPTQVDIYLHESKGYVSRTSVKVLTVVPEEPLDPYLWVTPEGLFWEFLFMKAPFYEGDKESQLAFLKEVGLIEMKDLN
jgi:hypothetical protein